jgi:hypothetical protein
MIRRAALAALLLATLFAGPTAAADSVLRRDNGAEPGTLDPEKFESIP